MRVYFTSIFRRTTLVALLLALVGSAVQVTPVYAASIVVDSNGDTIANDGLCTLREALIAAQQNAPTGGCAGGSSMGVDTISFTGNYTITVVSQLPSVTTAVTITGNGAANTIIQAAATPNTATWRVIQVTPTGNLTLDGVTVRHGRCNGSCTVVGGVFPNAGGGIYNSGTLTVTNSILSGNNASVDNSYGGAIFNDGTLTVTNSTISGNTSNYEGGAIENRGTLNVINSTFSGNSTSPNSSGGAISNGGTVTVINSTISGNTAGYAGGILNWGRQNLTVVNSTISGNSASLYGGGIGNEGNVTIINSTVAGNSAGAEGGGLYSVRVTAITSVKNTIIANNSVDNCYISGHAVSNGGNNLDSSSTCGFGSNAGSMSNTNPKLGPLANNGGPTQTMALLTGSPAIDRGNEFLCNGSPVNGVDQRGVTRPQGERCDIGAYEYNGTFWDVPLNYWAWDFVERLYAAGITGGCATSPLSYCPEGTVTRAQMAVFLLRGIHGAAYAPPDVGAGTGFVDVPPSYWAATFIKQLAAEAITTGCGSGNYCPEHPVTRAQMAVFLLRSKYGASYTPPEVGAGTGFGDVPTDYWAASWIKQLVTEGITAGCGNENYCPEQPVTRAQMAVFLVRTFGLP